MTDKLTALDLPMVNPLPASTQKYFDACKEKLGIIPNVLQAYAFDIDKLNAFTGFYNDVMLSKSGLSKLEREMIAVVVSSINKCFYCLTAHGAAVRELSENPVLGEQLVMNYHCWSTARANGLPRAHQAGRNDTGPHARAPQAHWHDVSRRLVVSATQRFRQLAIWRATPRPQ